ncbi:MAG: cation:proton antiporter [Anaerolineaceae bacterium]|nr:cation:proton antiporter [Anaerolineaceae bacterium]MCY3935744.1 cation:proton antiporter [Chloroflexota bacterium]MCY4106981.1 cation:proton antiporter [Chloroflexota bacterium]
MMDNPFFSFLLAIAIVLFAARIGGAIARRFDQSRVLGELLVGILLGPTVLDLLHSSIFTGQTEHITLAIKDLAELGVLLLMFKVGLEVHINELFRVGKAAIIAGVLGALVPVAMVMLLADTFKISQEVALFAGVTMAATSVSISAQVLLELGVLQTLEGNALLATALIDDVFAILLVSLAVAITATGSAVNAAVLGEIALRMLIFLVVAGLISWFILPKLFTWIAKKRRFDFSGAFGLASFAFIAAVIFGWAAEEYGGVAFITGSFIAGVGLSRLSPETKREIDDAVNNLCYVLLVPIFFVSIGLEADLSSFGAALLPSAGLLLIVAVFSKVIGCGGGALLGGFTRLQSLRLGVCMISRGEVGIIIASISLSTGVIAPDDPFFATLFLVIILTTVVTPPAVRTVFNLGDDTPRVPQPAQT